MIEKGDGMSRRDKLLAAMKNNPKDVSFESLRRFLTGVGCTCRQGASGGSHYVFTHPATPTKHITIPKARPVKSIYVKRALAWIEEIKEAIDNGTV